MHAKTPVTRRLFLAGVLGLLGLGARGQDPSAHSPMFMVRAGMLLLPSPTPLLSIEARVWGRLSLQVETNFVNVHGVTAKWYRHRPLDGPYFLAACAFVRNTQLDPSNTYVPLPYVGYGSVWGLGKSENWVFEARGGIGAAIRPSGGVWPLPVAKATIGCRF